jgi:alpha-beta hydrolase superfamily lysophospholipase
VKKIGRRIFGRVLRSVISGLIGMFLVLLVLGIYVLNQKPDLKVWHTAVLDAEFTATSPVHSFAAYLALENRLFAQLDQEVYDRVAPEDNGPINRYSRGSLSDPGRWSPNWNRSFELAVDPSIGKPKAGVLLIHGLSDSPYSLRALGERLQAAGADVVGLRVPGHGTAPAGLVRTTWQDMAAAVPLAMRHLREQVPNGPLYIIGYSNGGALAVYYALSTLEDSSLPAVERMVLISPEIGITRMAGLAIWQERIGRLLDLKKLAWTGVSPEYDPFKYCSFPVNAGNLAYDLTRVNREKLARDATAGKLAKFPPVLAFQSAVDATVSAPALVRDLFDKLPARGHELVVFDLNRNSAIEPLLKNDPMAEERMIRERPDRTFAFTLVTNANPASERAIARTWSSGQAPPQEIDTGLDWPRSVYSLSHVALPFAPGDPVYGGTPAGASPGIHLGDLALRGERGTLLVSGTDMLRLRWNPFLPYLEQRTIAFLRLKEPVAGNVSKDVRGHQSGGL